MQTLKDIWANRHVKTVVITGAALALPKIIKHLTGLENVYAETAIEWLTYVRVYLLVSPFNLATKPELPATEPKKD